MNIYLIKKGKDEELASYHVLNDKIAEITDGFNDISKYSLIDTKIEDIIDASSYFGMFNEKKVVIIDDTKYFAGKFSYEDDLKLLFDFIKKASDVIFIFLCDDVSLTKESTKEILSMNAEYIDLTNYKLEDKVEYLNKYLEKNNIKVDDITYLLKNSYENIDYTISEIHKLSNLGDNITKDMIDTYSVSLIKNDNLIFDLTDKVTGKEHKDIYDLFYESIDENIDLSIIIGALASSFENIYMVKECLKDGLSDEEIKDALGYNKVGRVYVMKKKANLYTLDELKDIIIKLSEIDKKIKTGYNPVKTALDFLLSL